MTLKQDSSEGKETNDLGNYLGDHKSDNAMQPYSWNDQTFKNSNRNKLYNIKALSTIINEKKGNQIHTIAK